MYSMQQTRREDGFTLLELLLVIGVAALLLIGGIATYRLVSEGNKATESTRLLLTIRQETATMAQQQGGIYTGLGFTSATSNTTAPLVATGVLRDLQRNAFNGPITITPVPDAAAVVDANITVAFGNVSQPGCTKMATAINNPNDVVSVTINGSGPLTPPLTAANVSANCVAGINVITWQFP